MELMAEDEMLGFSCEQIAKLLDFTGKNLHYVRFILINFALAFSL
jgi:hypothetical protein